MAHAQDNPAWTPLGLLAVGLVGAGAWWLYSERQKDKEAEEAFLALAAEVELEQGFNPMTLITKVGNMMGDLKVTGLSALKSGSVVEDDLGEEHKYTAGKAWLVQATIHGDPVVLLVRRNGSVELLEG